MADAERLALAKRLYDEAVDARDYHKGYLLGLDVNDHVHQSVVAIIALHSAKIVTMEAIFPELMEDQR